MSLELKDRLSSTVSKDTTAPLVPRWYFGGIASTGAACITHPLDTMKVYYQTSGILAGRQTLVAATIQVIKKNGFLALYNGLTASILRQLTYSTVRFGIYEATKQKLITHEQQILPLYERMIIAAFSGAIGGLVGTPPDVVNVRMQNDIKLETRFKRNYRNALQGLKEIY
ncbi:Mitochondrial dicarboxylate carrier-like protein, partial [Euroglyphus maynei]